MPKATRDNGPSRAGVTQSVHGYSDLGGVTVQTIDDGSNEGFVVDGGSAAVGGSLIKVRGDTAAKWATANPVLRAGEIVRETDTGVVKIGDGLTAYTSLSTVLSGIYAPLTAPRVLYQTAPRARAGMWFPTADGSGQLTHAAMVTAPNGTRWNGFRYWMVATPYPNQNDQVENPHIFCANDPSVSGGADGWQVPAGLTNPIEATPPDGSSGNSLNSDPDLEFGPDGTLYCFWRLYDVNNVGSEERIYVKSSTDGVTWSTKTLILSNNSAAIRTLAPSIVYDGSAWRMWVVDIAPSPNIIRRYSSQSPTGTWTIDGAVTLSNMPSGRDPWHIDVNQWGRSSTYHMLVNDVALNANGGGGQLYLAESTDSGMTWTVANTPVIPSGSGRWDNLIYRSSMVPYHRGDSLGYEIIYAGIDTDNGNTDWRLGYTTTLSDAHPNQAWPVHGIADPSLANLMAARVPLSPFVLGDAFARADGAIGTADSGQAWTVWAGSPVVSSKVACANTNANTKAAIDTGIASLYAELPVLALSAWESGTLVQAWLIVRGTDTNNYWRIGIDDAHYVAIEKVVSGATTKLYTYPIHPWHAGVKIGARCSGNTITVVVNGRDSFSATDAFNNTGTFVGFQTNRINTKIGYIYARSLVGGL